MNKKVSFVSLICIFSGLVACSPPPLTDSIDSTTEVAGQYETISVILTSTAQSTMQAVTEPAVLATGTLLPISTNLPAPTITPAVLRATSTAFSETDQNAPSAQVKCDAAQAARPIDITVPDDTPFQPGEKFTKIWRVVNTGTCPWNTDYAVVWFSGDDLGMVWTQPIGLVVVPGQSVDLSVDMVAPEKPGVYQSNWKIINNQGALFGIGPGGDAPFWVRIVVESAYTPTPEPTTVDPTVVPPPVILAQGLRTLTPEQGIDLNTWNSDPAVVEDLWLQYFDETDSLTLSPLNGAGLVYFGLVRPSFSECLQSRVSEEPLALEEYPPGAYICYRTADKMPGRMMLSSIDMINHQLKLEYLTWALP